MGVVTDHKTQLCLVLYQPRLAWTTLFCVIDILCVVCTLAEKDLLCPKCLGSVKSKKIITSNCLALQVVCHSACKKFRSSMQTFQCMCAMAKRKRHVVKIVCVSVLSSIFHLFPITSLV